MQVLPRRQSCDRCHNGKVRCIREETTAGSFAPCARCRRAGISPCVYSVQKTPGRQPNRRNNAATGTNTPTETPRNPAFEFDPSVELGLVPISFSAEMEKETNAIMEHGLDANKLSMFEPLEEYMGQLTQLSLRILRVERLVFASMMPLSIASPCFNEIFEATSSLISLINQYTDVRSAPLPLFNLKAFENFETTEFDGMDPNFFFNLADASMPDAAMSDASTLNYSSSGTPVPVVPVGPDPGAVLLILACHQRLLSVFERICLSVTQDLQDIQLGTLESFRQRHDLPSITSASTVSLTAQFVMAIQLVNHLLGKLDRALSPLSEHNMQTPGVLTTLYGTAASSSSSGHSSDGSEKMESSPEAGSDGVRKRIKRSRNEQCHGYSVGTKVSETMHQRHEQLRGHIRAIKRTINRSDDI